MFTDGTTTYSCNTLVAGLVLQSTPIDWWCLYWIHGDTDPSIYNRVVSRFRDWEGTQFLIQTACQMAWDHNANGSAFALRVSLASAIIDHAKLLIVQFAHSETPFSCVYMLVVSCFMPHVAKKLLKACDIYSPPPSVHKVLRDLPVSFSAHAPQALKTPKVSSLDLHRPMCVYRLLSSVKVTKYR